MKKLILFIGMLILAGCGGESKSSALDKAFKSFEYNGIVIDMNAEADEIVAALGTPVNYLEVESCAFQGIDKIFCYEGFELYTYPIDEKDYVLSVIFIDDGAATTEGIKLNAELDEVLAVYGDNYKEQFGVYTYTAGDGELSFMIENNKVVSIEYKAIVN